MCSLSDSHSNYSVIRFCRVKLNQENKSPSRQGDQGNKSDQQSQQPSQAMPGQKQPQLTQQPAGKPGEEANKN
jgi:hypothetical protein